MAVTLKRKRGAVSYREPSSDEDISESSDQEIPVQRKRAVSSRRSTRHCEPSNQRFSPAPSQRKPNAAQTSRKRERPKVSYKDVSTDEDEEDSEASFELSEEESRPHTRQPQTAPSSRQPRSKSAKGRSPRNMVLGAPLKPNVPLSATMTAVSIPTDGHQPAWASLPYHVLLQVFVYASHPLRDENMKPTGSIPWLVQMARMCSTFTKPALTALYRNPPVFALRQSRKDLVHHLISPPLKAQDDHRVMVKRLELDATQMTALTDHANSVSDLAALIRSLTTLREIDIFDPFDRPPFRKRLRRVRRWTYPVELFDALRQSELHLRSWRWNSTFCDQGALWLKGIHGDAAFQSLRELTLTKFHPSEMREDRDERIDVPGQPTTEELIASALASLPNLRVLSFETCGIVSGRLLPLLPTNLVSLSITNCGELLSEALQAFLVTHGAHLEELVLNHNQALDISFLVDLKRSCPKLESLRMDMTYYSSLSMSSDNEPLYETLLGENEVPTWPTTLRVLDMAYLRRWNSTAATNFFSSLVDAADELPWLQEITIVAMVDTDWRQRAEFRQKWGKQFRKVFGRKWMPPSPHLTSLRAYREWKARSGETASDAQPEQQDSIVDDASEAMKNAVIEEDDSDSDAPLLASRPKKQDERWGSKRLRSRSKATASYDEVSEEESVDGSGSADENEVRFVQGRCNKVLFSIDNFRPREEIFGAEDFLDQEPSGDEDWNGNDEHNDETGYAW